MKRSGKQQSEFAIKVAGDAVGVIQDLVDQGHTQDEIQEMFTICDDARKILDSMLWRMADNWTPAERERTVKALLLMADYVQDTKNPKEMATDAWVVEVFVMRILEQFHSYEAYEAKNYHNPLSLAGFASFFVEACDQISKFVARGFYKVARTSEKKYLAEWKNRPFNEKVEALPDHHVYSEEWESQDIYRLAIDARETARADDKKRKP